MNAKHGVSKEKRNRSDFIFYFFVFKNGIREDAQCYCMTG